MTWLHRFGIGLMILSATLLSACVSTPKDVEPIKDFELERYLGTWYEIARLDHTFERDLQQVTAEYSVREDGGVRVVNRGYNTEEERWSEAVGRAYPVRNEDEGFLKVSFFGPFFSSYVIFELERENYEYAFVAGNNKRFLWLLSRTPIIDETLKNKFLTRAQELGFNTDELIFVDQSQQN